MQRFYEFDSFRLDGVKRLLLRDNEVVPLKSKSFDALLMLVQNSGRVLEKSEMMEALWPNNFVEEANLTQHIFLLRKALGESLNEHRYIVTVPGLGYRFVCSVHEVSDGNGSPLLEQPPDNGGPNAVEAVTKECEGVSSTVEGMAGTTDRSTQDEDSGQAIMASDTERTTHLGAPFAIRATSGTRHFIKEKHRTRVVPLVMLALAIAIAAITIGLFRFIGHRQRRTDSAGSSRAVEVTRLTNSGKTIEATISPDGKYLAYVALDAGRGSIWVRHMATNSSVQIVPPTEDWFEGLTFSRDGNYVYYGRNELEELPFVRGNHEVYQVPILGGVSKKIISHVGSPISFSPDSKRFAFMRSYSSQETALIIANADGTGEQRLATRLKPESFEMWFTGPAWSPDGKIIACAVQSSGTDGYSITMVEVRVEDGSERPMTSQKWRMSWGIAWLSDGSGLVVNASITGTRMKPDSEIWYVSYPDGDARRIGTGQNEYRGISVTTEGSTIVTVQHSSLANIWIVSNADSSHAKQITSGASRYNGVDWTPDGRIVYGSPASGNPEIWIMNADGSNQKQLTDYARYSSEPSVSPDGRYIVFTTVSSIWRMSLDGSDPRQLTGGLGETFARCSPDGKWVVYVRFKDSTLWKVSIDGGEPVQLTFTYASFPDISPDGKLIAFYYEDEQANPTRGIAVIPFEGGQPIKRFNIPSTAFFFTRWTPDGHAVAYVDTRGDVSNILIQPLAGGPPRQLTEFKSDNFGHFGWSRDGTQLAFVRGMQTDDVVQIRVYR